MLSSNLTFNMTRTIKAFIIWALFGICQPFVIVHNKLREPMEVERLDSTTFEAPKWVSNAFGSVLNSGKEMRKDMLKWLGWLKPQNVKIIPKKGGVYWGAASPIVGVF